MNNGVGEDAFHSRVTRLASGIIVSLDAIERWNPERAVAYWRTPAVPIFGNVLILGFSARLDVDLISHLSNADVLSPVLAQRQKPQSIVTPLSYRTLNLSVPLGEGMWRVIA